MVFHICLLVELGPICNYMAASLCLKSFEDHGLLKSYNGGLWKDNHRTGLLRNMERIILAGVSTCDFGACRIRNCADSTKPLLLAYAKYGCR